MKNIKQKGLTIIEALISTALIGIGFIAIFQMVNFSVTSINTSGERTKANFLSSMIAEGFIGYKDSIGGLNNADKEMVFYQNGKAFINQDAEDIRCLKFSEYYMALSRGNRPQCSTSTGGEEPEMGDNPGWSNHAYTAGTVTPGSLKFDNCDPRAASGYNKDNLKPIHGPGAQTDENVVNNKVIKWTRMLGEDRSIRCKSQKDFKTVDMFEMCIWDCQIFNPNIYDEAMYVGRIQINLNDGKKRKFLYFQSDYKIKNIYSDYIPSEGDRDDDELEGFGG